MSKYDLELRDFFLKHKAVLKIEAISRNAGAGQRLRRFVAERDCYLDKEKEVNLELVKLYESLGVYLQKIKIIEPKGLFK